MPKLALFASGNGSNFQAIVDAVNKGQLDAEIPLLICDQKNAYVLERAAKANIEAHTFTFKDYGTKQAFEEAIVSLCQRHDIDYIILAGYMRIIGNTLLEAYQGRIINIHPSLLPSFPGLHAIEQAFEKGVKITGITVHYVDEGVDSGPIIAQAAVDIREDDTIETLTERMHETEHELYPKTIARLLETKGRKICK
ncbi:phosphoribosylglycinamide formyltransferase [Terrilactibacillus sp. BCM23-1]|uniref:Phosphoribosylglycinamide formyltransferase n=1 Tax=Terrilactibacillus tamarindi TaxID=2599694 RepID=A0A6N8CV40_9BACI|nr:phosphoribosylglycinamide formyltransferase [Terrilactibacillus tamarindi]MTT33035.1 phosphoribosylglycinamide formyltransferase [Terrilactibacillus tamarindi]